MDDTGERGDLDSKGGKAWILHPNEQVWSKKDRGDGGFRSREELKEIVRMHDNGFMLDMINNDTSNDFINGSSFMLNGMNTAVLERKMDILNNSIQNIDIPEGLVKWDDVRGLFTFVSRKGNNSTIPRESINCFKGKFLKECNSFTKSGRRDLK